MYKMKKITSVILALIIVLSTVSAIPIQSYAANTDKTNIGENLNRDASLNKYLFAYFLGEQDTHIRLAVSDDGYNYEALNGNQTLLNTQADDATAITFNGKIGMPCSGGARDPYILRKHDGSGFWIVATDLDTSVGKTPDGSGGNTYNNSKLLIWDVKDITNVANVKPWAVDTSGWFGETYYGKDTKSGLKWKTNDYYNHEGVNVNYCAWAPEVIWDTDKNMYMIYWSNGYYDDLRIYYAYTNDFKTYYKADGTELNGTNGAEPEILYDPGVKSIDGDITYDKASGKYYMFFKKEAEGQLYIVTADHASGPYSNERKFVDNNVTGVASGGNGIGMEGPEVYQLLDENYIFFADVYTSGNSMFQFYKNSDLSKINGDDYCGDEMVMNHLKPRHAGMTYITTDEYNNLKNKYGVARFDSSGILENTNVNDNLVARYFTTDNVTQDVSGNNNSITNHNATSETKSYNDQSVNTVKTSKEAGNYLEIDTSTLKQNDKAVDFNIDNGVTLSWNSYSEDDGNQLYHWVFGVLGSGVEKGSLSGNAGDNKDKNYLGFCANNVYTLSGHNLYTVTYQADLDMDNAWHKYVMTLTKNCIVIYKDNKLYQAIYAQNCTANDHNGKATPCYSDVITNDWIKDLFTNGKLLIGASAYTNDGTFSGNIYDFRIYNRALTNKDIAKSTAYLNTESADEALKSFEDKIKSGIVYTNMYPAYQAYVNLKKVNDVYKYGEKGKISESELNDYKAALAEAIAEMMPYSPLSVVQQYADAYTAFKTTDNNSEYSAYTSQMASNALLFSDTEQASNESGNAIGTFKENGITFELYYATNVLLYTGMATEKPSFPAAFSFQYTGGARNQKRYMYAVYPLDENNADNTILKVNNLGTSHTGCWYGEDEKLNYAYLIGKTDDKKYVAGESTNSDRDVSNSSGSGLLNTNNGSKLYYAANVTYNGVPTETLTDYTTKWGALYGNSSNYTKATKYTSTFDSSVHTYVINYKKVIDAINNNKYKLASINISDYREGGLGDFYKAFDAATGLDLTINKKSQIQTVASRIDTAVQTINNSETKGFQKDSADYESLRKQMDKYENTEISDAYTDESKKQYKTIYETSQKIMSKILDEGYAESEKCKTNATALSSVLNEKLDVSELTKAIDTVDSVNISNGDTQIYKLSSFVDNKKTIEAKKVERDRMSLLGKYDTEKAFYVDVNGISHDYNKLKNTSTNNSLLQSEIKETNDISFEKVDPQDCYDTYDACMQVYNTQDINAFTDEYLNTSDSVFKIGALNGSYNNAVEYNPENEQLKDTAYIAYNGKIYKNSNHVDAITTKVLTALNQANTDETTYRKKYNVTFEVYDNDKLVSTILNAQTHYYGDVITLDASVVAGNNTCYKWVVTSLADNSSKTITKSTNKYELKIQSDSVVKAYISSHKSDNNLINVKINSLYKEKVFDFDIDKSNTVDFYDGYIMIGETKYELPKMTFYKFKNWKVNDKKHAAGDSLNLNNIADDEVIIYAEYENINNTSTIKLDGAVIKDNVAFDTRLTISSTENNCYGLVLKDSSGNYQVVSYTNSYDFYTYEDMNFLTSKNIAGKYYIAGQKITDSDLIFKLNHKLPFVYTSGRVSGESNEKYSAMNIYTVGSSAKVTEVGVLYTTDAQNATTSNMVFGQDGVKFVKSKNQTLVGNQYSLTLASAKVKFEQGVVCYMRGYVKYSYVYTDKNGNTSTVQAISYGQIVDDSTAF